MKVSNTKILNTKVSKKFLVAFALLGSASFVHADYRLVPSDDSSLSKLCIAAATSGSRAAMLGAAEAAGIGLVDLPSVRCNGLTLERFALKYGRAKESVAMLDTSSPGSALNILLRKTDSSPLTELCAAAAVSDAAYARVKEAHFSDDKDIDAEIHCNDMPLKSFVRKYRNAGTALVSAR
ncbi:MAG: hypothetical protein ACO1PZ_12350 [Gammaproteobacteria bacterium]